MLNRLKVTPDGGFNCGKYCISGFPAYIDTEVKEQIESDLREILERQCPKDGSNGVHELWKEVKEKYSLNSWGNYDTPYHFHKDITLNYLLVATLKQSQVKANEPILLSFGFKRVAKWTNPNTLNKCYLYVHNGE